MSDIKLLHGDCYEIIPSLPDNSIDLIITDAPYKLGNCNGGGLYRPVGKDDPNNPYKRKATNAVKELKQLDCADFNATNFLNLIAPKMKKFYGFFFCNKFLIPEYLNYAVEHKYSFDIFNLIKGNPIPARNNHFLPDTEYCIMIRDGGTYFAKDCQFEDYKKNYIVTCGGKRLHPAQKPLEFIERFIRVCCPRGGVILDTFMGSGTTGLAAVRNSRNFIGIEKDDKYFELAQSRLKEWEDEQNGVGTLFEGGYQ